MATREEVTLVCDSCKTSDPAAKVDTRTLRVLGLTLKGEACEACWLDIERRAGELGTWMRDWRAPREPRPTV